MKSPPPVEELQPNSPNNVEHSTDTIDVTQSTGQGSLIHLPPNPDTVLPRMISRFHGATQRAPWRDVSTEGLRSILPSSTSDKFTDQNDVRHTVFEQPSEEQAQHEQTPTQRQNQAPSTN